MKIDWQIMLSLICTTMIIIFRQAKLVRLFYLHTRQDENRFNCFIRVVNNESDLSLSPSAPTTLNISVS